MPIELRELIIQARVDPPDSGSADTSGNRPRLTPVEREEIIEAVLARLAERQTENRDR